MVVRMIYAQIEKHILFAQGKKSYSQTNAKMNTYASLRENIEHRFLPLNKMCGLGRVLSALSGKFKTI